MVGSAQGRGNNSPKMHEDDNYQPHMKAAGSAISGRDLFIKVSANKKKVYEQEPILLTYKVYTLVDLTQLEGKMPELTGFILRKYLCHSRRVSISNELMVNHIVLLLGVSM